MDLTRATMVFTLCGFSGSEEEEISGEQHYARGGEMVDPLPWRAWITLYRRRPVTYESTVSAGYQETLTRYEVERTSIRRSQSRDTFGILRTGP